MSNLLEKASIVTTPTAYNNGKILSVKPAPSLGSELVTNGDFATDSIWNKGTGWSISGGVANCDGTNAALLFQSLSGTTTNDTFKVTYTISNYISGSVFVGFGSGLSQPNGTTRNANGTYTEYLTKTSVSTSFGFKSISFIGSIDNVSVKQEIDGDFDFTRNSSATRVNSEGLIEDVQILSSNLVSNGDFSQEGSEQITNGDFSNGSTGWSFSNDGGSFGWTIANERAICDAGGVNNGRNLNSSTTLVNGKTYKLTLDILQSVDGMNILVGSTVLPNELPTGTNLAYEYYIDASQHSGGLFSIYGGSSDLQEIDNVSVKEVGQDWTLVGDFKIGNNQSLITNASQYSQITNQIGSTFLTANRLYKLSADIPTLSISNVLAYRVTGGAVTPISTSQVVNGKFEAEFIMPSDGYLWFQTTGSYTGLNATITNISVIEITSDTNLPRINYEGFSYQDALGSELVTNGDFATDSNWTKQTSWSISGGAANYDFSSDAKYIRQTLLSGGFVAGKSYKINFEITSGTAYMNVSSNGGGLISLNTYSVGSYSIQVTASVSGSDLLIYGRNTSGTAFSIDNVSVKEYLGQEVVPDSGYGSWLFEPQSTNKITYSEDFTQWVKGGGSTLESGYLAPDGSNNAYKVSGTSSSSLYLASISNTTDTRTIWARTVSGTGDVYLCGNLNDADALFTVTSQWQRFELNGFTGGGAINFNAVDFRGSSTLTEVIIWGAQAEALSFATSYIPTNGSTVTRLQDAAFGSGSSDLINSTEGVLYAEIAALANDNSTRVIMISDGTNSNRIFMGFWSGSNEIKVLVQVEGGTQVFQGSTSYNILNYNKVAFVYKENDFSLWINGSNVFNDTSGITFPAGTLTQLDFDSNGSAIFFGKTKCVAVFKEALTDAELTCLTTI